MTRRAVLYCRISNDRTGAGMGVDRQELDCRELAGRLGWEVAGVHVDNDLSAYSGKPRPGYLALLSDLQEGRADAVIAWHTDRLHRSPRELEGYVDVCEQHGVVTHTVTAGDLDLSTASGRAVARTLGTWARYEVEHSIERMKRAKRATAEGGKWLGGRRPFGFDEDGVTVREHEADVIRRAIPALLAGKTLSAIAREANEAGSTTSSGNPWNSRSLNKVLVRPRNAGLVVHEGRILEGIPAEWPAIVPVDDWRAVVALLSSPDRQTNPGGWTRRWMGGGLWRCGVCDDGTTVITSSAGAAGKERIPCYTCPNTKHIVKQIGQVDRLVVAAIAEFLEGRADVDDLLAPQEDTEEITRQQEHARGLRLRLDEAARLFADGVIDARQLAEASRSLRTALADHEQRMTERVRGSALEAIAGPDPANRWRDLYADATTEKDPAVSQVALARCRAVANGLVEVTIVPGRKGRPPGWRPGEPYFDRESVHIDFRTRRTVPGAE